MKNTKKSLPGSLFLVGSIILAVGATGALAQSISGMPNPLEVEKSQRTDSPGNSGEEQQLRQAKPELVLQTGYDGLSGAARLVFSPDGRLLATASLGSSVVKLWETATGRELRNLFSGNLSAPGISQLVAFSPNSRFLAASNGNSLIKIWDVTSGRELQSLEGRGGGNQPPNQVSFLAFSPDGRVLVTIDNQIRVWDVATWRELHTPALPSPSVPRSPMGDVSAISPDGRQLALLVNDDTSSLIKLLDLTNGLELRTINLANKLTNNSVLSFRPDGGLLVAALADKRLKIIEATANNRELDLGLALDSSLLKFSQDGRLLALSEGPTVKVLDVSKGKTLATLRAPDSGGPPMQQRIFVTFSSDNKTVATGGSGTPTVLWEARTGKQLLKLNGRTNASYKAAFSRDGTRLYSGSRTQWDLRTGRGLRIAPAQSELAFAVPSPDALVLAAQLPGGLAILEGSSGRQLQTLGPATTGLVLERADFSRDGSLLAATYGPSQEGRVRHTQSSRDETQVKIWDVRSGRELQNLKLDYRAIDVGFSPDGRVLSVVDSIGHVSLWDSKTGGRVRELSNHSGAISALAFSPDALALAIGDSSGMIVLWDATSGRQSGTIESHGRTVSHLTFSRDSRLLAASSTDNTITIWDLITRRELRKLIGHHADINSIDFSPDSRLLASAGDDGSTFLWEASTGEHLLTLISLDDGGEWMVITPQGIFDGTPVSWNQILWRYDHDTFNVAPIEWFFNEFYYPGLLADVFAGKRPRVAQDVSRKDRRQPTVKLSVVDQAEPLTAIASRKVKVRLKIIDAPPDKDSPRGCGARDLRLFRNGSMLKVWRGDVLKGRSTVTLEEEVTLTAGPNRLTAYAFNTDNVKSKDAQLALVGSAILKRAGTAYIIVVGVNGYANQQYNLKYAVADAQSFGDEVRLKLTQGKLFERFEIVSLINEHATKANILSALAKLAGSSGASGPPSQESSSAIARLKRAQPEDAVIVFFAGHGTAHEQRFYLIPHDLGYSGERVELDQQGFQTILAHSISDLEFEQTVEGINAGHVLLLIDACNSGQALESEELRRGPMNSKGLAQLAYEKGMYILTAAQSYQAALEAAELGHGLLTYALVEEGLKTAMADSAPKDGVLNVREWLDFATERVPQMQLEKMKQDRGIGLELAFTDGEQNISDPEKRSIQRPRSFYRRELETNPLVISSSETGRSSIASGVSAASASRPTTTPQLSRWVDLQSATLATRYRFIESSQSLTLANQLQYQMQFRGRFKFDRDGNYSINAGVFTGSNFGSGFNDTGAGTGGAVTNLYLKQLFLSAKPIAGVELQFGGLYFNRGESTEITTYDNDGYLMGERLIVKRPGNFFFDEISATSAFLGDLFTPNINKRWHRLGQSNYHQFLISKSIGERAVVSTDYTFESGRDTLRQAVRVNTPEFKAIDFFRLEFYQRFSVNPEGGLAAFAEKSFLKKRLIIGGGYAQIDPNYGALNADRFLRGRRFFFNGSYKLTPEFTVSTFLGRAFKNDFPIANGTRVEFMFTYNLLQGLRRTGAF